MTKNRLILIPKIRVAQELAGAYRTTRLGQGLTFAELRAWESDDDARFIDWNATARTGRPYIRRYMEERSLPVSVILDSTASMGFGSKWNQAREAALLLVTAAISAGDLASLEFISNQSLGHMRMTGGSRQIHKAQKLLNQIPAQGGPINWMALKAHSGKTRRSMLIVLSDFLDLDSKFDAFWSQRVRQSDVIAVRIVDALEETLPNVGLVAVIDSETGQKGWVDTGSARVREQHEREAKDRQIGFFEWRNRLKMDGFDLSTQDNAFLAFKHFFQKRAQSQR